MKLQAEKRKTIYLIYGIVKKRFSKQIRNKIRKHRTDLMDALLQIIKALNILKMSLTLENIR